MDTQPIENPIKSGEMVLPFYEGHYYVAFSNGRSSNEMVTILLVKIKINSSIFRRRLVSTSDLGLNIYFLTISNVTMSYEESTSPLSQWKIR